MCDLVLVSVSPTAPTAPGGFGLATIAYTTASASRVNADAEHVATGQIYSSTTANRYGGFTGGSGQLLNLPSGAYNLHLALDGAPDCAVTSSFVVPDGTAAADSSLNDAPRWEPVGGVLPNSVLLKVEASLLSAGAARPGLHVEVELWRPAAVAAFATFRATVREAVQYVDAAPYLRAELRALQRYAASLGSPFVDADASLRFTYRYRVVDKNGAEPWVKREGPRYAVLAALAGPTDTMAPYVADGTGAVASVFADGEATQFVGYPLEASVLLPLAGSAPRWAELRYLDAWGKAVEIRSYALASTLPAGMLRIPLPADPPLAAMTVEVSVRDDNRAFVGTGGNVVPTPPPSTRGTYADPLYGLY
jgi:hypothetical protein